MNEVRMSKLKVKRSGILNAFTLVELLVVIGIIGVLVGILLPSLSAARESANGIKCAANMRSACQALQLYLAENKGWLPGPHTSGRIWPGNVDAVGENEDSGRTTPITNGDWISPTLGMAIPFPDNDLERLKRIYDTELRCPSNYIVFNDFALNNEGVTVDPSSIRYQSYAANIAFHGWPQREEIQDQDPKIVSQTTNSAVRYPGDYHPRITKMGQIAEKVYLVEGSRFLSLPKVSFNLARYQIVGGNFMVLAPWTGGSDTPFFLPGTTQFARNWTQQQPLSNLNKEYAWRHRRKMNLAFFDGHVELRGVGDCLPVKLYFPKGSRILAANLTHDPQDVNNQIVN